MLSMNQPLFKKMQAQTAHVLNSMKDPGSDEIFFKAFIQDLNASGICGFLSSFYIKELFDFDSDEFVNAMSKEGVNCFVIEQAIGTISNKTIFGVMFDSNMERLQENIATVNGLAKSMHGLLETKKITPFSFQH